MVHYTAQKTVQDGQQLVRRRFYLDEDLWSFIDDVADCENTTPSLVLDKILREYFETLV